MATKPWNELTPEEQEARLAAEEQEDFPTPEIVYPDPAEDPDTDSAEVEDTGFRLFLATLDLETRKLPDDELRQIYNEQQKVALEEKRATGRRIARELALSAARTAAGLVPRAAADAIELARHNSQPMKFTVDLPYSGENGEVPDVGLRVDQKIYLHGTTMRVTRAQFDSMREMQYRCAEMEQLFRGEGMRRRRQLAGRATGHVNAHIDLNADGSLA